MTVYLNGQFLPITEAKVSVLDRGFIFGDGVYEVIPVYSRRIFRLEEHLQRLNRSLENINLANPYNNDRWFEIIQELVFRNEPDDQYLYLHITRGVAKRDHAFPIPGVSPTVFLMSNPLSTPSLSQLQNGISAITAPDNRWLRCDIKAISLLPNVLLRQMAVDAGCYETIMIRNGEFLTEGSASNIFVVKNGVLCAPPKDNLMLPGITYDVVLELAVANNIPYEVRKVLVNELFDADELLLTSSTREVLAITMLSGMPVGAGIPGAMFSKLHQLYQNFKHEVMRA